MIFFRKRKIKVVASWRDSRGVTKARSKVIPVTSKRHLIILPVQGGTVRIEVEL